MIEKYPDIEYTYRTRYINQCLSDYRSDDFIVQERVRGNRLDFHLDHDKLEISGYKAEQDIQDTLIPMLNKLLGGISFANSITLYGKVIGGKYPHPNVISARTKNLKSGVYYHPDVAYIAYDLKINNKFINQNTFYDLMEYSGIPCIPELTRGKLEDCLCYPANYLTNIPEIYGLPEIKGNESNGYIIKGVEPIYDEYNQIVLIQEKNLNLINKIFEDDQ